MKKNIKAIAAGVILAAFFSLSACGEEASETTAPTTQQITLGLSEIAEYTVVYPERDANAELLANWLANKLTDELDIKLTVTSDAKRADGKEILNGFKSATSTEVEIGSPPSCDNCLSNTGDAQNKGGENNADVP